MGQKLQKEPVTFNRCPEDFAWYTVCTKYNYEKKFAEDFTSAIMRQDFYEDFDKTFLPWKEYEVSYVNDKGYNIKQKKKEKIMPLYVFVHCKMNEKVYDLMRNTSGFASIMDFGGSIIVTEDKKIDNIMEQCIATEEFIAKKQKEFTAHREELKRKKEAKDKAEGKVKKDKTEDKKDKTKKEVKENNKEEKKTTSKKVEEETPVVPNKTVELILKDTSKEAVKKKETMKNGWRVVSFDYKWKDQDNAKYPKVNHNADKIGVTKFKTELNHENEYILTPRKPKQNKQNNQQNKQNNNQFNKNQQNNKSFNKNQQFNKNPQNNKQFNKNQKQNVKQNNQQPQYTKEQQQQMAEHKKAISLQYGYEELDAAIKKINNNIELSNKALKTIRNVFIYYRKQAVEIANACKTVSPEKLMSIVKEEDVAKIVAPVCNKWKETGLPEKQLEASKQIMQEEAMELLLQIMNQAAKENKEKQ